MDYNRVTTEIKPTSAPAKFTIYVLADGDFIFCPIRKKLYSVSGKPEEIVRQWWIYRLVETYQYEFEQIAVEVPVLVGSTEAKKKADVVVYKDKSKKLPRIFIEVKKPNRKDGVDQLQVYMNATGCRLGLWSNGAPPHVYLLRIEPKEHQEEAHWRELRNVPTKTEELADVDFPITRAELEPVTDFLSLLKECEDHIKAHEGASVFEEIFKLVFAKLYDERRNLKTDSSPAQFRVGVLEAPENARARISKLFQDAKDQWKGVFEAGEEILLTDETLAFCVSAMQKSYLLKSDSDVLGSAFEVMINPNMKGDKGQYFTPRHVIKMCIDILNPQQNETIYDPTCGSGGFLVGAMDHVFKFIKEERDDENEILENQKDYASNNVFGADYDRMIAKVAKAYMLIWGDGRSNIMIADGLNDTGWSHETASKLTVGKGKTRQLRQFDIIATNPPFAGDISADEILSQYSLAYKVSRDGKRKRHNKVARDKLFIEQCLRMLKPGGRMAIVVPRGILKNYSDEPVRRHILRQAQIIGAVSLTGSMFKPFTNTKTCVLFVRKRLNQLDDLSTIEHSDPDIVFAVSLKPGKDRSGGLIRNKEGAIISDLQEISDYFTANANWTGEVKNAVA
jgi:type I restriction enzyme M protein